MLRSDYLTLYPPPSLTTGTFAAMVASIWLRHNGHGVLDRLVEAFIIAVTIIVVAIPEGESISRPHRILLF